MADETVSAPATEKELPPIRFFRAGGFDQIILRSSDDLRHLRTLDQTLWVASSCPTRGLDLEPESLDFVDTDGDERIRPPEILECIDWLLEVLRDPSTLPEGKDSILKEQINPDSTEGASILKTIARIHENLGIAGSGSITLEQTLDRSGIFAAVKSNGDGVIPPSAADSTEVTQLIDDIVAVTGGEGDQSGETGVTADNVKAFYQALNDYLNWWVQGHPGDRHFLPKTATVAELDAETEAALEASDLEDAIKQEEVAREKVNPSEEPEIPHSSGPELSSDIFTLGDKTPAALAAINAVRDKVENYYEQSEVAAFDARAISFLNFNDSDLQALPGRTRGDVVAMLEKVPLAHVTPDGPLPLQEGVNPAFAKALSTLNREAVATIFGAQKSVLTQDEWREMLLKLAPYEAWLQAKTGAEVENLSIARISEILKHPEHREALQALIAVDAALAAEISEVTKVEKLLRLHRDFFRLLRNYVSLPEFYDPGSHAIFQMGSLLIDGCMLNLCVEVDDVGKHATIASKSGIYLVYCSAKRAGEPKNLNLCAAVTNRDAGRIIAGKNAVFYDRFGKDWDAKVIQVVSNPISLRESIWAPFRKIGEIISSQFEKISAARQQAFEKNVANSISNVDKAPSAPASASPSPVNIGAMVAGGGVAIAALSSSLAYVAQTISKIHDIYLLYTILVVLCLIITPSLIMGFVKLRKRDIGMVLEACGWAINGRMRINLGLARELTHIGRIPKGALVVDRAYVSKDAQKYRNRFFLIFFALVLVSALVCWWILET